MLARLPAALEVKTAHTTLRLAGFVAVIAVALLLSGCSLSQRKVLTGITEDQFSNGIEPYFNVGGITYQIQESRALNAFGSDVEYFAGVKYAQNIPPGDFWYGVFLWAKNQSNQTLTTAGHFVLTDSAGNSYHPVKLNPNINQFAWTPMPLAKNDIEPNADSVMATDSPGGGVVLFELPYSVYQNRPLTLHIYAQGATKAASVSLDL
jgi:hypothetical protein